MSLWLIEGLPGSGKSTMAERLCSFATEAGNKAVWYLEEAGDHPVHPRSFKEKRKNSATFVEECLEAWSQFADQCKKDDVIHILERSTFQSTVRFMMEEQISSIDQYYRRYEEIIAPLNPQMIYLRPRDPMMHSRYISRFRGQTWAEKVAGYLEKTTYSRKNDLRGVDGMHSFWTDYTSLCDNLILSSVTAVKPILVVPGEWERHMCQAAAFLGLSADCDIGNASNFNVPFDADAMRRSI